MNEVPSSGLLASCANIIPMFSSYSLMDGKGKLLNAAFAASGAFLLGDHPGFPRESNQKWLFPCSARNSPEV